MSISWQLDATPAPSILTLPPAAASLDEAHAAIELWEHYSRKTADSSQRLAVEVMMAQAASGRWAAATTGREMARQNGKGDEIEIVEVWGLVQRGEAILHTVHDAVMLASQAQQRMLGVLEGHADLRRLVKRKWMGTGQQMIEMHNGGVIWYRTRTNGGGRGVDDIDRLVVDEAQHATAEQLAALAPTMLANKNPQINAMGSAGLAGKSAWWWTLRRRALSDDPGAFGYVGHTAERLRIEGKRLVREPFDPTDRAVWVAANPSLAAGRGLGMEFFEEELHTLGPALFAREHLCVWDPDDGEEAELAIPGWSDLAQVSSIEAHRQWALAVSPDRRWASLGAAGVNGAGKLHVEWVEHRAGTEWVIDRCVEAFAKLRIPIRVHKAGPEGSFIAPLRAAGVDVDEVATADVARATGMMIDAARNRELVHLGQPSLDKAVRGAQVDTAKAGSSIWSQRSAVEITPLMAVTVALGGVPQEAPAEFFVY